MNAERLTVADTCPDCGVLWNPANLCPKCGIDRTTRGRLIAESCGEFERAREAASAGRYRDARVHLRHARALGLRHAAADDLERLCRAALGEWLPAETVPDSAARTYGEGRAAATRGDWRTALAAAEHCCGAAPWLLPAQKLRLLALHALGNASEAEAQRQTLLRALPEEPDLCRYRFDEELPPATQRLRRTPRPLMAAALVVSSLAVGWLVRPVPTLHAMTAPQAAPHKTVPSLSAPFAQERDSARADADFTQARRWFNEAITARRARRFRQAARLASAAGVVGHGTYLEEEALLLEAQLRERLRDPQAADCYTRIATQTPHSVYAPFARRWAARARRNTR